MEVGGHLVDTTTGREVGVGTVEVGVGTVEVGVGTVEVGVVSMA